MTLPHGWCAPLKHKLWSTIVFPDASSDGIVLAQRDPLLPPAGVYHIKRHDCDMEGLSGSASANEPD